jgi:peptidoglycan/xylan/chitin deacetylase (PgdA/CDA1 family)
VAITFDDGYADNYNLAFPVLRKYRLPATIYVVSSTLEDGDLLWTSRLRYALTRTARQSLTVDNPNSGNRLYLAIGTPSQRDAGIRALTNVYNTLDRQDRERQLDELFEQCAIKDFPSLEEWFLSRDSIDAMSTDGIDFGAHTVSHPNLPALGAAAQREEIRQCKLSLERHRADRSPASRTRTVDRCIPSSIRRSWPKSNRLHFCPQ